jgi:putative transposase
MELSIKSQCELLGISRSAYYYKPEAAIDKEKEEIGILKAIIDELRFHPFYGYRKIAIALKDMGVTKKQIRLIMKKAGLRAIYPGKRLSIPVKWHEKYPYLLKDKDIWLPNQVWATDITYIKLCGGHVYLVAIIDLFSRKTLSWRLSNTLDTEFCVSALDEAIMMHGKPAIFNTDQGSQFTSEKFTEKLKSYKIRISMDGKGRALDNIYIERLWRSLKYEEIYLNEYRSMEDLKIALKKYFNFYNTERFHQSLEYATPDEIYNSVFNKHVQEKVA